jgi:hypothetical protein
LFLAIVEPGTGPKGCVVGIAKGRSGHLIRHCRRKCGTHGPGVRRSTPVAPACIERSTAVPR